MILEIFSHLISLDIAWLAGLFASNLLWVFGIFAASHFVFNKKRTLLGLGVIFFVVFIWQDVTRLIGWVYLVPGYLAVYYLLMFAFLTGFENTKPLKKWFVVGEELLFIGSLVAFNLFMG